MSHTPGPWAVREPDAAERAADIADGAAPEDMELTEVYAEDDGEQLCFVLNTTASEADNARLISAAPDLLEACELLLIYLGDWDDMEDETCVAARRAIAKAKGQEVPNG